MCTASVMYKLNSEITTSFHNMLLETMNKIYIISIDS
jgi:hypothetical protein